MSENHFPAIPVTAYGMVLAASLCYSILQAALLRIEAGSSALGRRDRHDVKGKASV